MESLQKVCQNISPKRAEFTRIILIGSSFVVFSEIIVAKEVDSVLRNMYEKYSLNTLWSFMVKLLTLDCVLWSDWEVID